MGLTELWDRTGYSVMGEHCVKDLAIGHQHNCVDSARKADDQDDVRVLGKCHKSPPRFAGT